MQEMQQREQNRGLDSKRSSLGMSVMLTNIKAGNAKKSASLLNPSAWSMSKALRFPAK
jgi:hypothetical protein